MNEDEEEEKSHTTRNNTINLNELTESSNFPIPNKGDFFSICDF